MGQGGSHYVSFVFCPFIHCEDALEHHQSKSSSSMPSSWATNFTTRGGRSFRVGATPRAEICCRCASIHRRSSSVLMPAARAIWSLLFAFIVGRGFDAAKIRLFFPTKQYIYINIYIYCGEKTQRNPTKPTYSHGNLLIPYYSHEKPRKAYGGGVGCRTFALRLGFGPWSLPCSLRLPLDVPYRAARNGGVGSGECG